jgi:two-component system sensor histidine kinase YesM
MNADEDTLDCLTLKLVLQPLIENAIVHGIEYHMDEGCIEIRVYRENDKLVFRITDNGVGMTEEQMSKLLVGSPIVKSGAGSGVAVRNVHDRIQLYYGEAYGLEFDSELEEGTTVWIRIPLQWEREEDDAHDEQ